MVPGLRRHELSNDCIVCEKLDHCFSDHLQGPSQKRIQVILGDFIVPNGIMASLTHRNLPPQFVEEVFEEHYVSLTHLTFR